MKRGFTLLELLTVIAIMAMLTVLAIGGYRSAVKGMRDRGALTVVQTFVDQIVQRAIIDRQPVTVFFYDELLQKEDEDNEKSLAGAGIAVAVRMSGRVSEIDGKYVFDEFNDLDSGSDELEEDEEDDEATDYDKTAMRIYRMVDGKEVSVSPKVEILERDEAFLLTGDETGDAASGSSSEKSEKKLSINAFRVISGENPFARGDAYGTEFATVRLPNGYFFGSSVPTQEGKNQLTGLRMDIKPDGSGANSVTVYTFNSLRSTQLTGVGTTSVQNN